MRSLALFMVIVVIGCRPAVPPPSDTSMNRAASGVPFRILKTGSYGKAASGDLSASPQPSGAVATTETAYRQLWEKHIEGEPPPVDFSSESVVFLLLGLRSTGGHAIEPQAVETSSGRAKVSARVISPKPGGMATMAFTAPFAVIAVAAPGIKAAEWIDTDGMPVARTVD